MCLYTNIAGVVLVYAVPTDPFPLKLILPVISRTHYGVAVPGTSYSSTTVALPGSADTCIIQHTQISMQSLPVYSNIALRSV